MATLSNNSSGNFNTAATWSLVDTTSLSDSEAASTALTTTFTSSAAFTPGIITIDGIGLKILSRAASPSGTVSVRLFNNTLAAAVTGTTVTINVSDLAVNPQGWAFFKFASSVLLLSANSYSVQASVSVANNCTAYRTATATDWSRYLRTTTTQAPASGDVLYVNGEHTGAAAFSALTVTMNNTASTQFGKVEIGSQGVLSYGTAASTNYLLKLGDHLYVNGNGTLNIGTVGTPIPSTSTASLQFNVGSNVAFGFNTRGQSTVNICGATKTGRAYLNANAAAAATTLTSDISTGWLSGDNIAIASTSTTVNETEANTLTGNASGTSIPVSAIGFAHTGTTGVKAELINTTRNVKIFGASATLQSYIVINTLGAFDMRYAEVYNLGSATAAKRGIDLGTTTGSCNIQGCAFRNFEVTSSTGINVGASAANTTISDCVFYRISNTAMTISATATATMSVNNVWAFDNIAAAIHFTITAASGSYTNMTAVSAGSNGFSFNGSALANMTVNNIVSHSNTATGVTISTDLLTKDPFTYSTFTTWYNRTRGVLASGMLNCVLDTLTSFGNLSNGLEIASSFNCIFKNMTIYSFGQPIGITLSTGNAKIYIDSSTFGVFFNHATADVSVTSSTYHEEKFRNCFFASPTEVSNVAGLLPGSEIGSARHNQTAGLHKTWRSFGIITSDTSIFGIASPSQRLTPNNTTQKLETIEKRFAIPSGKTAKIKVSVRKSVAGDGTAYNGNQPRLILKADPANGVAADTVLATASGAAGSFETLSATTPTATDSAAFKILVDCDGSTGWVNVDDWKVDIA